MPARLEAEAEQVLRELLRRKKNDVRLEGLRNLQSKFEFELGSVALGDQFRGDPALWVSSATVAPGISRDRRERASAREDSEQRRHADH